ncbi:two-component sensor histidine kinase [Rhodanobacter sp. FW510-R12]|uniref:sensor histidine kinase n=1 Tax=unclassified Rhodanobacter TaxID=2621553 RepID=UPI0007A9DFBE|nr:MULTISPECIES: ATP-binding protein [unclassified Rhodanobacter]KZC17957.1 two-component sensor histidine kinase [Rhodanobacter sp. FW104-R8]KZC25582.1 two-component sensor histidine kinase [Rhodanobacter sp. FW510-T8]KZC32785.1 two-component sensor histidine kinase [Rhodanobacter sp. FW510-R10]
MKSIGARITFWYALSATLTVASLFIAGYQLLQNYVIRDLDLLNATEFQQIKARLGSDYPSLNREVIEERIRQTTEYASVLFYISIDSPSRGNLFRSKNLAGNPLPDVPKRHVFEGVMPGVGELRIAEFVLPPFDVSIGTPMGQVRRTMVAYTEVCLALLIGMLLASIAIGLGLSRVMLRPVRLIGETANRIRSDNLTERIAVTGVEDEISGLATLLNQMFDRLESSFNQVRQFAAEVSHELKTPLSLVRLHAEKLLVEGNLGHSHEEAVLVQLEELARVNQMVDELLFLSRAEAQGIRMDLVVQDPHRFLRSFEQDVQALTEHRGCRFSCTHYGEGLVAFEERWLRQVVLNILTNALRMSPPGGLITLRSELEGHIWRVSIEDEGPGLTDDQYERAFERFVRFNQVNTEDKGSGLGLAICRSIIQLHNGRIHAECGTGGAGLRVVFEIPAIHHDTVDKVHAAF